MTATLDAGRALVSRRSPLSPRHLPARRPPGSTPRQSAATLVNVGFIYSADRPALALRRRRSRGFSRASPTRRAQCGNGTRSSRPTSTTPPTPRRRSPPFKDLIGQGVQDHRRHRLVRHRASARAARRAEQHPLHLRRCGGRRDHRPQPQHVPRRPADAAGRARRREHLPAEDDGQEDRRLRRGHGVRPGQLRRRQARSSAARATRLEDPRRRSAPRT